MTLGAGLSDERLRRLDDLVEEALASGDEQRLPILGYGEISLVLGWPAERPEFACKRMPPFRSSCSWAGRGSGMPRSGGSAASLARRQTEIEPLTDR